MNKIKKVLSIDLDYIMGPSIVLYNDLVGNPEFAGKRFWEKIEELRGIEDYLKYDEESLLFLVGLFTRSIKDLQARNIFFAKEHDMILEFLCGNKEKASETFEIFNIDHHHDIYYGDRQKEEVDRFDFACLANWVYYLGKNEKIAKYHWIKNEKSIAFPEEDIKDLVFPVDFSLSRDNLWDIDFDYVFVCQSSEYLPRKFHQFFYLFKAIADNCLGESIPIWEQDYCVDGKTRHVEKGE